VVGGAHQSEVVEVRALLVIEVADVEWVVQVFEAVHHKEVLGVGHPEVVVHIEEEAEVALAGPGRSAGERLFAVSHQ
jgi:hypothetical protein